MLPVLRFTAFALSLAIADARIAIAKENSFDQTIAPAIRQYCGKCHGESDEVQGGVNLLALRGDALSQRVELVGRMIDVLDLEEMPPADEPQPSPALRTKLVVQLKSILHDSIAKRKRYSPTPMRRLNRFQYNNAVTDLFDLDCIVFTLPERMMREHGGYFQPASGRMADVVQVGSRPLGKSQMIEPRLAGVAAFPQDPRAEHGFDNRADHLSLSPLLMEAFLKLGRSITQSPDFNPRRVGIWKEFFAPPASDVDETTEVRRRLRPFLTRAFRRPVDDEQLDRYVVFATRRIDQGSSFTDAMKSVAAATIASPRFLYLYDTVGGEAGIQPVDDFELASRLSFFLWGSLPDATLLELAASGRLQDKDVLSSQFDRMVTDRKLKRFCDSFPAQWLQLERIVSSAPNREKYPAFYFSKYRASMHMMIEPLLIFETVLIENQPITQLVDSDFTYRSGLLEHTYGKLASKKKVRNRRGVTVLNFHRVPVTDRRTGGVITNAAVMTMTAGRNRTQPITRGAWVASVIFNNPPDPPPADVPPLSEKPAAGEENLTLRERLASHRQRSDCKGCHEKIDPLGFALENYNPIGAWRERYENGREIDAAGALFRKHEFSTVVEFKDAILAEKHRFARALAGHLLSFALARELDAADQIALDEIVETTAADNYRMQTLLKQVVLSEPFQSKSNPENPVVDP